MVLWNTKVLGKNKLKELGTKKKGNKKRDLLLFLMLVTNQIKKNQKKNVMLCFTIIVID